MLLENGLYVIHRGDDLVGRVKDPQGSASKLVYNKADKTNKADEHYFAWYLEHDEDDGYRVSSPDRSENLAPDRKTGELLMEPAARTGHDDDGEPFSYPTSWTRWYLRPHPAFSMTPPITASCCVEFVDGASQWLSVPEPGKQCRVGTKEVSDDPRNLGKEEAAPFVFRFERAIVR
ncbi:hypothetical protein [Streptomyces geysiriensis]|uniref:hypothetical protein n=1 Tax=Streptomyces geysiriensis TaxID=68207 RepID=UPI001C7D96A6|nr:hypothetical protein [Streptomyces geysiriensis]MBX4177019.1 hypothetical protein [Streptomyces geysiriensis]